jgi:hypothetical protein
MSNIGIRLNVASYLEWGMCAKMIENYHYLHSFPDPRCLPLVYSIRLGDRWIGSLVYGRTESNRCYQGDLTYGSREDVETGRARYDRWEIVSLARVYLLPDVQSGGSMCMPSAVPGFTDRKGVFRSMLASHVVRESIRSIVYDYLMMYPPCFLAEPYQIRVVSSYCDTKIHRGTLYRASGFRLARTNRDGIETWAYESCPPLTESQDADIRAASKSHRRSRQKRSARGAVDLPGSFFAGFFKV